MRPLSGQRSHHVWGHANHHGIGLRDPDAGPALEGHGRYHVDPEIGRKYSLWRRTGYWAHDVRFDRYGVNCEDSQTRSQMRYTRDSIRPGDAIVPLSP